MGMNIGQSSASEQDVMIEMNMTPLIDVMLVLIIMLIITIPIQNHAINLHLPVSKQTPPVTPPPIVEIAIDVGGVIYWNGVVVTDRHTLDSKLQAVAAMPDQPDIHIKPNKLVAYKWVAEVMASAQRLGVTKIGLTGNEQFL